MGLFIALRVVVVTVHRQKVCCLMHVVVQSASIESLNVLPFVKFAFGVCTFVCLHTLGSREFRTRRALLCLRACVSLSFRWQATPKALLTGEGGGGSVGGRKAVECGELCACKLHLASCLFVENRITTLWADTNTHTHTHTYSLTGTQAKNKFTCSQVRQVKGAQMDQ